MILPNIYNYITTTMKLEMRENVLKQLKDNYALIRDEDWEVLCLVWRDDNGYYSLYMEHYNLSKEDVYQLLDKSAGIALIPVIDEKAKALYEKDLIEAQKNIESQLDKID